jgi:hypothetical protein
MAAMKSLYTEIGKYLYDRYGILYFHVIDTIGFHGVWNDEAMAAERRRAHAQTSLGTRNGGP